MYTQYSSVKFDSPSVENHLFANFDEGGDSQMNELIWFSWLGGIIIGTMVGANMVLEEHCKAGPRNVVITGRFSSLSPSLFFPPSCWGKFSLDEELQDTLSQIKIPLFLGLGGRMEAFGQFEIYFAITCKLHNSI